MDVGSVEEQGSAERARAILEAEQPGRGVQLEAVGGESHPIVDAHTGEQRLAEDADRTGDGLALAVERREFIGSAAVAARCIDAEVADPHQRRGTQGGVGDDVDAAWA